MNSTWMVQPWVRILLVVSGLVAGVAAYFFVPPSLIAAVSKTSAVFLGAVWVTVMGFALKVSDITEAPTLTPDEHASLEAKAQSAVKRIWVYAGAIALSTAVVLAPSVLIDAGLTLTPFVVMMAGGAIGFVVHAIVVHAWWQEELRRFRSGLKAREREEKRAEELRKKYGEAPELPLTDEVKAEIARHTKAIDWPTNSGPH